MCARCNKHSAPLARAFDSVCGPPTAAEATRLCQPLITIAAPALWISNIRRVPANCTRTPFDEILIISTFAGRLRDNCSIVIAMGVVRGYLSVK